MPVTAKLSGEFYEKLGDKVVNELVSLLNLVDANSRSDLRELNEGNFARLDATIARFEAKVEQRFAEVEGRFASLEAKFDQRFAESDARWEKRIGDLRAELIKWMFVFWSGTTISLTALMYAMLHGR